MEALRLVIFAGAGAGLLAVAAAILLAGEARQRDLATHIRRVVRQELAVGSTAPRASASLPLYLIRQMGEKLQTLPLFSARADLVRAAQAAGLNPTTTVPAVIGGKVLLMIVCPILAYLSAYVEGYGTPARVIVTIVGLGGGMMIPEWVLGYVRGRHAAALERGLPDALDLLVVCAEAGLGMESAVERVSTEMRGFNLPVALEFATLGQEMRISSDRRAALMRMGERTGLESFQRLTATLSQAMHYGTPLGQALRVLAAEMRDHRMLRIEEKAARLPSLLTLPMILFIFPCQFIILVGPAAIRILNALSR